MTAESFPNKERCIRKEVVIAAGADRVWQALTDDHELMQWFPLEARVTPGISGKIFLSWGPACEGEAQIVAWEPGKKFAWQEELARIEWTLETHAEKTLVRLVQSGFAGEIDWEGEWLDATDYGWNFMLAGLRLYLEKHIGEERNVAWPRLSTRLSREDAYRTALSAGGLFVQDLLSQNPAAPLHPNRLYTFRTTTHETYTGTVQFVTANRGFCLTVRELNDALFWFTLEGAPENVEAQIWLSAFGVSEDDVHDFNTRWQERLKTLYS